MKWHLVYFVQDFMRALWWLQSAKITTRSSIVTRGRAHTRSDLGHSQVRPERAERCAELGGGVHGGRRSRRRRGTGNGSGPRRKIGGIECDAHLEGRGEVRE